MRIDNWEKCSYQNWYPQFYEASFESVVIPIPEEVVSYLREDGLVLPKEAIVEKIPRPRSDVNDSDWEDSEEETRELKQPSFPNFSNLLTDAIKKLGGSVFIKLNWSAPVDAAWITAGKTLKCTTLEDIYLLLKSSERSARDISYEFKIPRSDNNYFVILKRWHDIHPGSEYRCFVFHNQLIAISQRDCKAHYNHITNMKYDIIEDIKDFYQDKLKGNFLLSDYVFDVIRKKKAEIYVIDFSPFDSMATKPLLFDWDELRTMINNVEGSANIPEFRYLGEEPGYQPNYYGVPHDIISKSFRQSHLSLLEHIALEVQMQAAGVCNCSSEEELE